MLRSSTAVIASRPRSELLAERGLDISYETVRRWVLKFGPVIVAVPSGVADHAAIDPEAAVGARARLDPSLLHCDMAALQRR